MFDQPYAFLSYSSCDLDKADAMRQIMEQSGVKVWIAPRDIPAGYTYAKAIGQAIRECSCFVLMLSKNAQESVWVPKEVERAVNHRRPVIPVQLDEWPLNDEFGFYISTNQIVQVGEISIDDPEIRKFLLALHGHVGSPVQSVPEPAPAPAFAPEPESAFAAEPEPEPVSYVEPERALVPEPEPEPDPEPAPVPESEPAPRYIMAATQGVGISMGDYWWYASALTIDNRAVPVAHVACEPEAEKWSNTLERLCSKCSAALGFTVRDVVIAVPSSFTFAQRELLYRAAQRAGVKILRIVPESSALAFGYQHNASRAESYILSACGNSNNLSVSLAHLEDGVCEIQATSSSKRFPSLRLLERCRAAIDQVFSDAAFVPCDTSQSVICAQGEWGEFLTDEIEKRGCGTVADAGLYGAAMGAAVLADKLCGGSLAYDELLLDSLTMSLGVEAAEGRMHVVLPRNTTIPAIDSVRFATTFDNQTGIDFEVYQGENDLCSQNAHVGSYSALGLTPAKKRERTVDVSIDVDANGYILVSAKSEQDGYLEVVRRD